MYVVICILYKIKAAYILFIHKLNHQVVRSWKRSRYLKNSIIKRRRLKKYLLLLCTYIKLLPSTITIWLIFVISVKNKVTSC